MNFKLDENQRKAVNFHIKNRWSFNCMNMGEGKTLTALETARQARCKSILVICPASLKQNWKDEISKFYGKDYPSVTIQSYASSKKQKPHDALILDEFHYIKNPDAKRSDRCYMYVKKHKPKLVLGLSGTPMKQSAADFFTYFSILEVKHSIPFPKNFYVFQNRYCNKIENDFTPSGYSYDGVNEENKQELKNLISNHFYFTPKDLRPILPETIDKRYIGKVPKKHFDEYMLDNVESEFYMSAKKTAAEYNVTQTVALAKDLIYQGKRPVIFTDHRDSAIELAKNFQTSPIMGGVSATVRNDLLHKFDKNISTVLVGTYGAMGTGLNITSSDTMILNDYGEHTQYSQARKRIHRKGQHSTCFYHHVFCNEYDYRIFNRLMSKKKDSDEMHRR